jgi:tRNA dimethylallyltransferase
LNFNLAKKKERDFAIIKIGLELPKEKLHQNLHQRIDDMMDNGLLDEVKNLILFKNLNALQTVGYKELFDYLEGKMSLDNAIEQIKINTRHYAKRQMTWFKKDEEIKWFDPQISFLDISHFLID